MVPLNLTRPYRIGDWRVDPALDELGRDGRHVKLEPRVMRLLCCLAARPGEVVSVEELLDRVWTGVVVSQSSVYQAVADVRRLLGDTDVPPRYIVTVPRKGYRLIAEVTCDEPADRTLLQGVDVPVAETTVVTPHPDPSSSAEPPGTAVPVGASKRRHRVYAAVAIAVVAGVLLATFLAFRSTRESSVPPTVAVLPFADLSADASNRVFCEGLTDELLDSLARLPDLRVIGRASPARLHDVTADARDIGTALGATHVLEGSVRRNGRRVRVSAQLVSTRDGFQVWASSFDRSTRDIVLIQTQIARAVADALASHLTPAARARIARAPLAQVNAYELYLLGRHQQLRRTPEGLGQAITYHMAALAADPVFALAHAGLADAYIAGYRRGIRPFADTMRLVQAEVDAALRLDPELAEAHAARATLLIEQGRPDEAIRALQHALAIDSSSSETYLRLGIAQEHAGRPLEALATYDQVAALDPLNTDLHVRRCLVLLNLGRHDEAARSCARAFELQPEIPDALWARGLDAFARGDLVTAIGYYRGALTRAPHRGDIRLELATLYLDLGMVVESAAELSRVQQADERAARMLAHGWRSLAAGDRSGLQRLLQRLSVMDTAPHERVDAASLALAAGDSRAASAIVTGATWRTLHAPDDLTSAPYRALWGVCELCTLALLQYRLGDAAAGAKTAAGAAAALDALEARGFVWHGLHYRRAGLLAQDGRLDAALDSLERAVGLGWRRAWMMRVDPALDGLRQDARFTALLARIDAANAHSRAALAEVTSPK